jgi:hypothetical protein
MVQTTALNDIYAATDEEFEDIFPNGADVEFIEDFIERVGEERASAITNNLWKRYVAKGEAMGIRGTLYYQLLYKKRYYPTKKESEMVALGTEPKDARIGCCRGTGSIVRIVWAKPRQVT